MTMYEILTNRNFLETQKQECLIFFLTYALAYLCFPSIIIYKPFRFFNFNQSMSINMRIAWLGCFNVGSFLVANAFGNFWTLKVEGENKVSIKWYTLIVAKGIMCAIILYTALSEPESQVWDMISYIFMCFLAYANGLTSAFFY